jgi:hypothetical protein
MRDAGKHVPKNAGRDGRYHGSTPGAQALANALKRLYWRYIRTISPIMIWTEDMLRGLALLGLDPENPRHRDPVAKFIERARAEPPAPPVQSPPRGRPKGSGVWKDDDLVNLAAFVDFLKKPHLLFDGAPSDTDVLRAGLWGFGGGPTVACAEGDTLGLDDVRWISSDTFRNLLIRGRQILRQRVAAGQWCSCARLPVGHPAASCTNNSSPVPT